MARHKTHASRRAPLVALLTSLLALALVVPPAAFAASSGEATPPRCPSDLDPLLRCTVAPIRWAAGGGDRAGSLAGDGRMVAVAGLDGVAVDVVADGLTPGHSYTLWVNYYNHPDVCLGPGFDGYACGIVDLFANPAAGASSVLAGGLASATGVDDQVSGRVPAGTVPTRPGDLADYLLWRLTNNQSPIAGISDETVAMGTGLLVNPLGAEYQIVLWDHGPHDPERFGDAQQTMHNGGCHLDDGYMCFDLQSTGAMGTPPYTNVMGPAGDPNAMT
jgi:hypothetical protein